MSKRTNESLLPYPDPAQDGEDYLGWPGGPRICLILAASIVIAGVAVWGVGL